MALGASDGEHADAAVAVEVLDGRTMRDRRPCHLLEGVVAGASA
jgi:hypothetical protein